MPFRVNLVAFRVNFSDFCRFLSYICVFKLFYLINLNASYAYGLSLDKNFHSRPNLSQTDQCFLS